MTTIGVYDSGVGGLTTLALLKNRIPEADFYYLADNKNMPLGSKKQDETEEIVYNAVKRLEAHSDVSVLACNTASITTSETEVFKLLPDLNGLSPSETLVLATPLTLSALKAGDNFFNTADTSELAALVEIQCSLCYKTGKEPGMTALRPYLEARLKDYKNSLNVVLGCSHYIYLKDEIKSLIPGAAFSDGNFKLVNAVADFTRGIRGRRNNNACVRYDFTGGNESKKYAYILNKIEKSLFFKD